MRERLRLFPWMLPHTVPRPDGFVDVVSQMHHQIEVLFGHVAIRREVAVDVFLAGRSGETKTSRIALPRRGPRTADRTLDAAGQKLIPIPAPGFETPHFHVNRVRA